MNFNAMSIPMEHIVMMIVILLTIVVIVLLKRVKGFIEEESIAIPTLVSPVFKIIKLMFFKVAISIETILVTIAVLLIAFTVGYVATYTYSYTTIDAINIPYSYSILLVSNSYVNQVEELLINATIPLDCIRILQVFREIPIKSGRGASYLLPLLIECNVHSIERSNNILIQLCKYVKNLTKDNVLIDISNRDIEGTINVDGAKLSVIKVNISEYLSIQLLPGIPLTHTIGVMGGSTITASPSTITVIPYSKDFYEIICKNECNVKTFFIITSQIPDGIKDSIVKTGLRYFEIVALRRNNSIDIYSRSLVPSAKTILGITSSILISLIFSISISGGLAEKVIRISEKLSLMGVTYDIIIASVSIAITSIFAILITPLLIILISLGAMVSVSMLSYILSATATNFLLTYKVSRKLKLRGYRVLSKPFLSINTPGQIDSGYFKQIVQKLFALDDIFMLSEVEVLRGSEGYNEIRIELIYRKSFATIVTVEVYEEKGKDVWSYTINVDVWSIEELSKYEQSKIASLALSKVQGALMQCITRF